MNNMEEALYRAGAHIAFKTIQPDPSNTPPTNKMKVPVPIWRKRKISKKSSQRVIRDTALDPVDRQAAIVTSKTPIDSRPIK